MSIENSFGNASTNPEAGYSLAKDRQDALLRHKPSTTREQTVEGKIGFVKRAGLLFGTAAIALGLGCTPYVEASDTGSMQPEVQWGDSLPDNPFRPVVTAGYGETGQNPDAVQDQTVPMQPRYDTGMSGAMDNGNPMHPTITR